MRRQAIGEEMLEQIRVMPLSNVWVTPEGALPVSRIAIA